MFDFGNSFRELMDLIEELLEFVQPALDAADAPDDVDVLTHDVLLPIRKGCADAQPLAGLDAHAAGRIAPGRVTQVAVSADLTTYVTPGVRLLMGEAVLAVEMAAVVQSPGGPSWPTGA